MAKLSKKMHQALGEDHILILGAQVLVGFQYRAMFEAGFDQLPKAARYLILGNLMLMVVALALLLVPVSYHWIVEQGRTTEQWHRFTTTVVERALLPFAIGLGINFGIASATIAGTTVGALAGISVALLALFFWYALEAMARSHSKRTQRKDTSAMQPPAQAPGAPGDKLADQIDQVLEEARMVLPGAQALMGFQFAIMLVDGFGKLPRSAQYLHLGSFGLIVVTTMLLMTPAAYHRLVDRGEDTPDFPRVASRLVLAAMTFLALGIATDFAVVAGKVTGSNMFALVTSLLLLACFYGLWFGYTWYQRWHHTAKEAHLHF